jgi:hypothetical protein
LTCFPAFGLYFRPELFFEELFLEEVFFEEDFFFEGALRVELFLLEDFFADDFRPDFLLAFFVAMGETSREIGAPLHQLRCITGLQIEHASCSNFEGFRKSAPTAADSPRRQYSPA